MSRRASFLLLALLVLSNPAPSRATPDLVIDDFETAPFDLTGEGQLEFYQGIGFGEMIGGIRLLSGFGSALLETSNGDDAMVVTLRDIPYPDVDLFLTWDGLGNPGFAGLLRIDPTPWEFFELELTSPPGPKDPVEVMVLAWFERTTFLPWSRSIVFEPVAGTYRIPLIDFPRDQLEITAIQLQLKAATTGTTIGITNFALVPEPGAAWLLLGAGIGLVAVSRCGWLRARR